MENVEQDSCVNVERVLLQYQCKNESIQNAEKSRNNLFEKMQLYED